MSSSHAYCSLQFEITNLFATTMSRKEFLVLFLVLTLASMGEAFLLNLYHGACPAQAPCTCNAGVIDCHQNLPHGRFPFLENVSEKRDWHFNLQGNRLSTLPEKAFERLNPLELRLDLSNNNFSSISSLAFKGVEAATTWIDLSSNRLLSIPHVLTTLPKLRYLALQYNPIFAFQDSELQTMGRSLEEFHFGSSDMTIWPSQLHNLRSLKVLGINGISRTSLPNDAFHGFENTLDTLEIHNTQLESIPTAVCRLSNLKDLIFDGNLRSGGHKLISTCTPPLRKVGSIRLDRNGLTAFPSVYQSFPNVVNLTVTNNPNLIDIHEGLFPDVTETTSLHLSDNGFRRVPVDILKLQLLDVLDLEGNSIDSIHWNDLRFPNLEHLNLKNNPIQYVSNNSFCNTPMLREIQLGGTNLRTVPPALACTQNLTSLHMEPANIECTCSLSWMTPLLSRPGMSVTGTCQTSSEKISSYVNNRMGNCYASSAVGCCTIG